MNFAKKQVPVVYGHDISGVLVPSGCEFTDDMNIVCDVITYFDALEHYPNVQFVKDLKAETIIISLPYFPGLDIFPTWKHRKPNEHLHFYTKESLQKWMWKMGWRMVAVSKHEDIVRKSAVDWNILVAGFKRK